MLKRLQHLFTPHHTNNHRPRILHPAGLALLITIFLFSNASIRLLAAYDDTIIQGNILGYASNIFVGDVIEATNRERVNLGKKSLTQNPLLTLAAQAKATDMFAFDYWAHNNPTDGKKPWAFIREAGYTYRYAGENLARDFGDTSSLMAAWMASSSHRANIVSDRYSQIGIAVVNGTLQGIETTLVVQMFGTPASPSIGAHDNSPTIAANTLGDTNLPNQQAIAAAQEQTQQPEIQVTGNSQPTSSIGVAQASQPESNQNPLPPFAISKAISMSILLLLSIVLLVDYAIIKRRKTVRVTGKNLAHLSFIGIIIIIVLISAPGGIL